MKYEVVLTDEADQNVRATVGWYASRSQEAANRWYWGLLHALTSLEQNPQRCPASNESARFPVELKQLLYGSGRRITHRIIFAIRPKHVVVYAVRHVAQQDLDPNELFGSAGTE
jgi:plasmid stabilization system protein ParE